MISVVYFSSAAAPMRAGDLDAILDVSQENNAAAGVTGLLCHYDGSFLQFLEGEAPAVQRTFDRIAQDVRHHAILKVHEAPIQTRAFAHWSMGLVHAGVDDQAGGAFRQNLRDIQIPPQAEQRAALEGFLNAFRAWMR